MSTHGLLRCGLAWLRLRTAQRNDSRPDPTHPWLRTTSRALCRTAAQNLRHLRLPSRLRAWIHVGHELCRPWPFSQYAFCIELHAGPLRVLLCLRPLSDMVSERVWALKWPTDSHRMVKELPGLRQEAASHDVGERLVHGRGIWEPDPRAEAALHVLGQNCAEKLLGETIDLAKIYLAPKRGNNQNRSSTSIGTLLVRLSTGGNSGGEGSDCRLGGSASRFMFVFMR